MTTNNDHETTPAAPTSGTPSSSAPLLAEDVLLTLLSPASGTIGGEGTLFYVLGGAVLTELAATGAVTVEDAGWRGTIVTAVGEPPADPVLLEAWTYLADKPRNAQTVIAAVGPTLRAPLLERLVERGDVRPDNRKVWGPITRSTLEVPDSSRRADLVARLRAVLVDGAEPDAWIGALGALVSASDALPTLDAEIPWGGAVATRAKALEKGDWGAGAAGEAVTRTMAATIVSSIAVAVAVRPR